MRASVLAAGLTLGVSASALAEPAPPPGSADAVEPVRVHYAAHLGCPDRETFLGQVLARTRRARRATDDELARTFVVRISPQPKASRGILTLSGTDSDEAAREVTAKSCGDVVSALALVAALIVDPEASTAPLSAPPTAPAGATPLSAPATPAPGVDRGISPSARASAQRDTEHFSLTGALAGELMGGVAPDPVLLPRASLELAWQRAALFAPSVRLSAGRGEAESDVGNLARASFVWVSGRLELCPIAITPVEKATFRPCAAFEAGAVTAKGDAIAEPHTETRPLLAAAALGRASFWITDAIGVELYGGVAAPLIHDQFVFIDRNRPPGQQVISAHTVPAVSGVAGLAIALKTPLN